MAIRDAFGWSTLPTRYLFVRRTPLGNDATGDGTDSKPFASIARAMAAWTAGAVICVAPETFPSLLNIAAGGTAAAPMVITSYPGLDSPSIQGVGLKAGNIVNHLWLVNLKVAAPSAGDYPIDFLGSGTGLRVEGCRISGGLGVRHQAWANGGQGVRWRDCEWYRTFIFDVPDKNGAYFEGHDNLVLEEGGVLRCGRVGDMFDQGYYIHQSCGPATTLNLMVAMNNAGGLQQRTGGIADGHFFFRNPVNMQLGHAETPTQASGVARNMVAVDSANIGTMPRGHAYWFGNTRNAVGDNLIALHQRTGSQPVAFLNADGASGTILRNSCAFDWNPAGAPNVSGPGITAEPSCDFRYAARGANAAGVYPNPGASLPEYAGICGLQASESAFWDAVLAQSKTQWRAELGAKFVTDYFRSSLGRPRLNAGGAVPTPEPTPVPPPPPPPPAPAPATGNVDAGMVGPNAVITVTNYTGAMSTTNLQAARAAVRASFGIT